MGRNGLPCKHGNFLQVTQTFTLVPFLSECLVSTLRILANCNRVPLGDFSSMIPFMNEYTAAIQKDGKFWIGWIEEVPGVNTQGDSREELLNNLHSALTEALEMNREEAQQAAGDDFEEVRISA